MSGYNLVFKLCLWNFGAVDGGLPWHETLDILKKLILTPNLNIQKTNSLVIILLLDIQHVNKMQKVHRELIKWLRWLTNECNDGGDVTFKSFWVLSFSFLLEYNLRFYITWLFYWTVETIFFLNNWIREEALMPERESNKFDRLVA